MKTTLVLVATAAVASAQVTFDPATGKYKCAKPNVAYCAGDSLNTDIIIRCDADGVGQPGRCTDNLAGQPPVGVQPALCYQTNPLEGDAACEKNCIVYAKRSFTLPSSICTPWYTATSSYPPTSPPTYSPTTPPTYSPTSTYVPSSPPTYTPSPPPTKSTSYPTSKSSTTSTYAPTTPPTGKPTVTYPPHGNGTTFTYTNTNSRTDYPHPTYTPPPVVTAGAAVAQVGAGALAAVGLAAAYFL